MRLRKRLTHFQRRGDFKNADRFVWLGVYQARSAHRGQSVLMEKRIFGMLLALQTQVILVRISGAKLIAVTRRLKGPVQTKSRGQILMGLPPTTQERDCTRSAPENSSKVSGSPVALDHPKGE